MSEKKYFLKYVVKEFFKDIVTFFKGFKNFSRPKVWFLIFAGLLIYYLIIEDRVKSILIAFCLLLVWIWDLYVAGAWKHEYREENIKKLREKFKE